MTHDQYLKILGLQRGATAEQIKKAYRKKARLFHPDLNRRDTATNIFIAVNEAYEYLIEDDKRRRNHNLSEEDLVKAWQDHRKEQARKRAYQYSRSRYNEFKKSKNYRSSMILNKALLFITLGAGIFISSLTIIGYFIALGTVNEYNDVPSLAGFMLLLSIGVIFIIVSIAHIQAFNQQKKKSMSDE